MRAGRIPTSIAGVCAGPRAGPRTVACAIATAKTVRVSRSWTRTLGVLAFVLLPAPLLAAPSSNCLLNLQSDYVSPMDRSISDETRQEVRQRVLIDALDDADIVFRGRLSSRRYLSDVTATQVPLILEIYENAVVLKGRMPATEADGRVYLVRVKPCSGGCPLGALPEMDGATGGHELVMLAKNNTLANPSEARDWGSEELVYSGRIDALNAPCDPLQVNQSAALALITAPEEMERLKRAYPRRSAAEKSRDAQELVKKLTSLP